MESRQCYLTISQLGLFYLFESQTASTSYASTSEHDRASFVSCSPRHGMDSGVPVEQLATDALQMKVRLCDGDMYSCCYDITTTTAGKST